MEQQQFNPGENRKSWSATISVPHSSSARATTEHHVAGSAEQHPQRFLLQKAPTGLRSLRLLRMNGTLFVGGRLQSILHSNYSSASQQPCEVGIFLTAQRLTKVAETEALSGRTGDPRVLIARCLNRQCFTAGRALWSSQERVAGTMMSAVRCKYTALL